MTPTLHVLGIPHTIIHPYFNICSFTKNTWSFTEMMKKNSPYRVVYYGAEVSRKIITRWCDDFESIYDHKTIFKHKPQWLTYIYNDSPSLNQLFKIRCEEKLKKNYVDGDIIVHTWFNYPLNLLPNFIQVCVNIGCFTPVSTPHRSFVSYACMNVNLERQKKEDPYWFDRVIPPAFDVRRYPFVPQPQDYFVYLGRIIARKGLQLIIDLARIGLKIVVLGPTNQDKTVVFPQLDNLIILNEVWDEKTKLHIISNARGAYLPDPLQRALRNDFPRSPAVWNARNQFRLGRIRRKQRTWNNGVALSYIRSICLGL